MCPSCLASNIFGIRALESPANGHRLPIKYVKRLTLQRLPAYELRLRLKRET